MRLNIQWCFLQDWTGLKVVNSPWTWLPQLTQRAGQDDVIPPCGGLARTWYTHSHGEPSGWSTPRNLEDLRGLPASQSSGLQIFGISSYQFASTGHVLEFMSQAIINESIGKCKLRRTSWLTHQAFMLKAFGLHTLSIISYQKTAIYILDCSNRSFAWCCKYIDLLELSATHFQRQLGHYSQCCLLSLLDIKFWKTHGVKAVSDAAQIVFYHYCGCGIFHWCYLCTMAH
jgi:hypothetical protein